MSIMDSYSMASPRRRLKTSSSYFMSVVEYWSQHVHCQCIIYIIQSTNLICTRILCISHGLSVDPRRLVPPLYSEPNAYQFQSRTSPKPQSWHGALTHTALPMDHTRHATLCGIRGMKTYIRDKNFDATQGIKTYMSHNTGQTQFR